MHGDVGARSNPGKGSTLWADLELSSVTDEASRSDMGDEALGDVSGLHVLVVDDNVINREILSTMLERANARVTQAVNGQEAVESVVSRASGCGFAPY
jgi:PleD family two-component response regulator